MFSLEEPFLAVYLYLTVIYYSIFSVFTNTSQLHTDRRALKAAPGCYSTWVLPVLCFLGTSGTVKRALKSKNRKRTGPSRSSQVPTFHIALGSRFIHSTDNPETPDARIGAREETPDEWMNRWSWRTCVLQIQKSLRYIPYIYGMGNCYRP